MKQFNFFSQTKKNSALQTSPKARALNGFFEEGADVTSRAIKSLQQIDRRYQTAECPASQWLNDQLDGLMNELALENEVFTPGQQG